jgi:hypothetical protein
MVDSSGQRNRAALAARRMAAGAARYLVRYPRETARALAEGVVVVVLLTFRPSGMRRQREEYWQLARRLGIDHGNVVRARFTRPGGTPALRIESLRPGTISQVLATIARDVAAAGYTEPVRTARRPDLQYLCYPPPRQGQEGLPWLRVEVYLPGERMLNAGVEVPADQVGLDFIL